jgi:hypothetical protein
MLVLTGQLHKNQKDLETQRQRVKDEEEKKDDEEENTKEKSIEYSQISAAINNTFIRCQSTLRNKSLVVTSKDGTLSPQELMMFQLDIIVGRICDLIEIVDEYDEEKQRYEEESGSELRELTTNLSLSHLSSAYPTQETKSKYGNGNKMNSMLTSKSEGRLPFIRSERSRF